MGKDKSASMEVSDTQILDWIERNYAKIVFVGFETDEEKLKEEGDGKLKLGRAKWKVQHVIAASPNVKYVYIRTVEDYGLRSTLLYAMEDPKDL